MTTLRSFFARRSRLITNNALASTLFLSAALAATSFGCSAGNGAEDDSNGGVSATGGNGGSSTGGAGGVGGVVLPSSCDGATPGARLLRRLTRNELIHTQQDIFGEAATSASTALSSDSVDRMRLSNDSAILMMGQDAAQALLERAEEIADVVTDPSNLSSSLPCSASSADEACARQFIDEFGQSLFRRELTQAEEDRYAGLFSSVSTASDFSTGLKWVLVGLIQSPHAVYRSELGGDDGQLLPYEIASELSYNYSASPPSAELLAKALSGELADPDARFEEAKKLLSTPRGTEVLLQFFEEWLSYRDVLTVSRANTPDNFEAVRPKMVLETEAFLDKLLFEKSGTLADLLTANFTVADSELASYYGFSGGAGDLAANTAAEVQRDWGLGVFGQGSVTTSMASITITSPTRRGLLMLRRLYCEVPGAPEAINFDLTASEISGNTTRERLENSHLAPTCANCHARFDPLGFSFEHIDHVGRYRTEEVTPNGSFPVDASVIVASLGGLAVDGQEELMQGLVQDPVVLSCISSTLTRYVYGGEGTCRAPDVEARAMSGDSSIIDFLADLARADHFVRR